MEFKDKLRELINEKGISSPEKLSKELNGEPSPNTIRKYLNGTKPKSMYYYQVLANFFEVDTDFLYNDSNNNRKIENKSIGEQLGLSDESIKKIKEFNNNNEISYVNSFINDYIFNQIINSLPTLDILHKAINMLNGIGLYNGFDINIVKKTLEEVLDLFKMYNNYPISFKEDINILIIECDKYTKTDDKEKQLNVIRELELALLNKIYQEIRVKTYDITYFFSRYIREYTDGLNDIMGAI